MKTITVKSQKEFDAVPDDFRGSIYIEFGTASNPAVVSRNFNFASVVAWGNSSVEARENSSVVALENSSVEARENSSVVAWENSSVVARENSSVVALENSSVVAWENSSVVAWENSSVVALENSSVVAWENSSVVALENSSVVAWENSSVEARGNVQVCDRSDSHKIQVFGNARIVYMPKTIAEYLEHYQIENDGVKAKLYKAVRKIDGCFVSDNDRSFVYAIGETAVANGLTTDPNKDCGRGIHMAYKEWCVDYGRSWNNLAILEVEAEISGIIVPVNCPGKVRAESVKVLREVPLQECGLYGKILAKKLDRV